MRQINFFFYFAVILQNKNILKEYDNNHSFYPLNYHLFLFEPVEEAVVLEDSIGAVNLESTGGGGGGVGGLGSIVTRQSAICLFKNKHKFKKIFHQESIQNEIFTNFELI
jgi:hypothetical protein